MTRIAAHVATLIASSPGALDNAALDRARALLPAAEPASKLASEPVWLADGIAADLCFSAGAAVNWRETAERLRAVLGGKVDVVVQPAAMRRKKLFLADMDSTMIRQECIDELADYAGIKPKIAAITARAMRGEIAFEPALRERVALLRDLPVSAVDDVLASRITLMPGARTLIATMRAQGALTCMVSGGFTLFTRPIAAMIGFDESRGNSLIVDNGRLSGRVAEPVFGRDGKRETLIGLRERHALRPEETMAIGDGANDMDMIAEAGLGIAFHAKPKVAQAAPARIDHGDLTALLYVQGYRKEEFVE